MHHVRIKPIYPTQKSFGGKPAAKKIIINGQILIIRDGKIYNAQGVQIR
jgi:hypothetical protein